MNSARRDTEDKFRLPIQANPMKCVFDAFRFFILLISFTAVVRAQLKEGNAVEAKPRSPAEQLTLFTVPEGFSVELVASEQTWLPKPVMTAFDDSGRLW